MYLLAEDVSDGGTYLTEEVEEDIAEEVSLQKFEDDALLMYHGIQREGATASDSTPASATGCSTTTRRNADLLILPTSPTSSYSSLDTAVHFFLVRVTDCKVLMAHLWWRWSGNL